MAHAHRCSKFKTVRGEQGVTLITEVTASGEAGEVNEHVMRMMEMASSWAL